MHYTNFSAKGITANLEAEKNKPYRAHFPNVSEITLAIPTKQLIL